MSRGVRSTQGYAENAAVLIERYESLSFDYKHEAVLHLIPHLPCTVMDIGAGTGADAAGLAARGHHVLAVEPTDALRRYGMAHHTSPLIEWVDDCLPDLERLAQRRHASALIMLTAVWMHLDEQERRKAMPIVASLLAPDGTLIMTLRHGPVPAGRIMYPVSAEETLHLAERQGLRCVLNLHAQSKLPANRAEGVTWSHVAFTADHR